MKNGMYTALHFGAYTLSAVIFIPFLIKQYGSGSYGLIALAGFLTQYVGMISGCVGSAVARFINIALNKNDWKQANEIFSTALAANIGLMLIQLPLYVFGVWKLDWLIDFPPEIAVDFRILVICNILIFFISTATGVLFTPIQAANRLDISAKVGVLNQILRILLLIGLILSFGAKLWIIGVVDLGLTLLTMIIGFFIYRRLASRLVFKLKSITQKWIRPVMAMAGWSLIATLGYSFFVSSDIWLINRFVSAEMAGVYAALLVIPNFIIQISGKVSSLIAPVYMIDFAKENHERIISLCLFLNKLLGIFAAFSAGFIFVFSEEILTIWLGENFVKYASLLKLMAAGLPLTLGGAVVWCVFPAINKTHYTGISNIATGILNLALSLFLVYLGYGVFGVAIGTLVCTLLKSAVIESTFLSKSLDSPYRKFLFNYAMAVLVFLVIYAINALFYSEEFWLRAGVYCVVNIGLAPFVYYVVCTQDERRWLKKIRVTGRM